MIDDPIDALERELVAAARRAAEPSRELGRPARRISRPLRRVLLTATVLVPVIAVVAVALAIHSGSGATTPALSPAKRTPPKAVLAVLRRPGTAPSGQALSVIQRTARTVRDPTVEIEHSDLRQLPVTVASGHTVPLDLVVVREPDGRQLIGLTVPSSGEGSTGMMYTYASRADQAYATVGQLQAGGLSTWLGQGRGNTQQYAVLVPDGVARVRLGAPGHPIATVHDNVAGFSLSNASPTALSKQLAMTWLNASGQVVRRVAGARLPTVAQLHARVDAAVLKLRAYLGVLRRPATAADRAEQKLMRDLTQPGMTLVASSVRVARRSRATGPIVIAIVRETADGTAGALLMDKNGGGPTAPGQLLRAGGLSSSTEPGHQGETTVLVPDGVRVVALTAHGVTTRATVRNNVALLAGTYPGLTTAATWYGVSGKVIKRIPAPGQ